MEIQEDLEPKFYELKLHNDEDLKQSSTDIIQQELLEQQDKQAKQRQLIQCIFNYSSKNAEMVQTILLSPNYGSPSFTKNGLQLLEQTENISPKLVKPLFKNPTFKETNQIYQTKNGNTFESKDNHVSIASLQMQQQSKNSTYSKNPRIKNQRTSIFLENQNIQVVQEQSVKNQGCIPLKKKNKTQTMLIQTYRKIWSRYQSLQAKRVKQEKQKEVKQLKEKERQTLLQNKDQSKKKKLITYDYNGQPIILKHIVKQCIRPDNQVIICPQKQNIITCPMNKLKKRKAQIFQSNQNFQTDQVAFEPQQQTQFLKITDKIKKIESKTINQEVGKSKKINFSEFKRRLQLEKKLLQEEQKMKKQRNIENKHHRLSQFIDRKQSTKSLLMRKKKCNSQQKIITNYKIFQDIFQIKARKVSTLHNKQNKTNLKMKTVHQFNDFKNLDDQLKYIQNFRPSSRFNRNSYSNFQVHQIDKQIILNNSRQNFNRNSACSSDYEQKGSFFLKKHHFQNKKNGKMQSVQNINAGKIKFKARMTHKMKD